MILVLVGCDGRWKMYTTRTESASYGNPANQPAEQSEAPSSKQLRETVVKLEGSPGPHDGECDRPRDDDSGPLAQPVGEGQSAFDTWQT